MTRSAAAKPGVEVALARSRTACRPRWTTSGSRTAGSGSVRSVIASRAARARAGVRRRDQRHGLRRHAGSRPRRAPAGPAASEATTFSPGMSAAVTTTTCDQSKAGSRSIPSSRACGSVARTVAPYHAPGTTRSSVKRVAPVSLSMPSRRRGSPRTAPTRSAASATVLMRRASPVPGRPQRPDGPGRTVPSPAPPRRRASGRRRRRS